MRIVDGKLVEASDGDAVVHMYVAPDEAERKYMVDQLKIDEHTLNSSLDPDELSRLEFEPDHIAVIYKRPKNYCAADAFLFKVFSAGVFVFKDKVVIVVAEETPLFEGKPLVRVRSIHDVLLRLIHRAITHFVEHLKGINAISAELEQQINTAMDNKYLLNLFTLEKSLVYYINAISTNAVLVEKLKNNAVKIGFTQENIELLDDLLIENNQCRGQAEIYSQVLSGLMDARASIISNNLNIMMKNLNALVIAVAVPSFFAGMGGMSEFSNMIQFENWKAGYALFFIIMVVIGVATFMLTKRVEKYWKM
jgi:magnesium transporter